MSPAAQSGLGLAGVLRLAWRDLRSGLKGFHVFIACVALGVAVIAAVGTLSEALRSGLARQGEQILGGDMTFARMHARAEGEARAWINRQGSMSETASLRAVARTVDGQEQALIELKGVDAAYPLAGQLTLSGGATLDAAIRSGRTAAVDPVLLERLGLKIGDMISVGEARLEVRAAVLSEPDAIADRLTYGPRVLVSLETLETTGFIKPGTLVRWRYAVALGGDSEAAAGRLDAIRTAAKSEIADQGFTILDRRDPSPQVSKTLERLRQFLTLLGLTALLTGGVGVANAVASFVEKRRKTIAVMRSLGATGRTIFQIFLAQVMLVTAAGVAIGLVVGALLPEAIMALVGDAMPVKADLGVSAGSLVAAALFGFLVALLFALWPLGRAEQITASALFRDDISDATTRPRTSILAVAGAIVLVLVGAAIVTAESQKVAAAFVAGVSLTFALFAGLGVLITRIARRMRRPRRPELALAIGNIGAPGGLTRSVVLSLGTGLSLLVAVALADHSLVTELESRLPSRSPDYFLLDTPPADYDAIAKFVSAKIPGAHFITAPMLRGRLVALKGQSVETIKAPPEAQWVLNGDRGITYADEVPEGSKLVRGPWWAKGYDGPPLVSFEADLAEKLGVAIGDEVTVNVLGRNITARIANLREVKWESLALNFVLVFSPNTLSSAPHNLLATLSLPKDTSLADEVGMARALGQTYPAVTAIRVKDAIDAFHKIFTKVMTAVRVAGSVTLAAGALVLAGALATAQRRRIVEAVILKALGATRRRILTAHLAEYALLALVTAALASVLGSLVAWVAVTDIMKIGFAFSLGAVVQALAAALALVFLFGGAGTWLVLKARPVPHLRSE